MRPQILKSYADFSTGGGSSFGSALGLPCFTAPVFPAQKSMVGLRDMISLSFFPGVQSANGQKKNMFRIHLVIGIEISGFEQKDDLFAQKKPDLHQGKSGF